MPDFPRVGGATAAEVWGYATRELTGFTGTPRTNLVGADESIDAHGYTSARAGKLDNLDATVSSRSTLTDAQVWAYTTRTLSDYSGVWAVASRTLTAFTGQPRTDLLGEDASFEAGTGARKAAIDKMLVTTTPTEGTLTADGSEQTVVEKSGTLEFNLDGYIDLTNMASGDTVVIKESMKIKSGGNYVVYASETYTGAQSIPLLHIITKPSRYALKITLQQTAGTYRDFDYQFFQRIRTA